MLPPLSAGWNPRLLAGRGWRAQDRVDEPGVFPIPAYPKVSLPRPAVEAYTDRAKKTRQLGTRLFAGNTLQVVKPGPLFFEDVLRIAVEKSEVNDY